MTNIIINKENGKTSISSYNLIPYINIIASPIQGNDHFVYKLSDYNDHLGKSVINISLSIKLSKFAKKELEFLLIWVKLN
jgi:hypothetical protein